MSSSLCCPFCHSTEFPSKVAFRTHRQFCEFVANTVVPNANELDAASTVVPAMYHQIVRNLVCEVTKMSKQIEHLSATVAQLRRKQTVPLRTHLTALQAPTITFEQWFDVNRLVITHGHLLSVFGSGSLVRGMTVCLEFNFDSDVLDPDRTLPFAVIPARSAKSVYVFSGPVGESSPAKWQILTADVLLAHLKTLSRAFMTRYLAYTKETPPPSTESAVLKETQNMQTMVSPIRPVDVATVMRALHKKALTTNSNVSESKEEGGPEIDVG